MASPIVLSGNTDPYQPAEKEYEITRSLLEVFWKHRHPVQIITKNSLILRDLDILSSLAELGLVQVAISLTTLDEELRRVMEPRTASGKLRIRTIRTLASHKVPVRAMMAPIIPGLNDTELMEMAKQASHAGAVAMSHTIVRLNGQVADVFTDWIQKTLPLRADRIISQIKSCHEGQLNDSRFGMRQKGSGKIAEMIEQQAKLAKLMYYKGKKMPTLNLNHYQARKNPQLSLFTEEQMSMAKAG